METDELVRRPVRIFPNSWFPGKMYYCRCSICAYIGILPVANQTNGLACPTYVLHHITPSLIMIRFRRTSFFFCWRRGNKIQGHDSSVTSNRSPGSIMNISSTTFSTHRIDFVMNESLTRHSNRLVSKRDIQKKNHH